MKLNMKLNIERLSQSSSAAGPPAGRLDHTALYAQYNWNST